MKKLVLAFTFTVLLGNTPAFADTQTFNAYGAKTDSGKAALNVGTSLAFPGFTLDTSGFSLQLDPPGWFGAPNYELLGNQGDLTIDFTVPQSSFSIRLRDFKGFGGTETITVFGVRRHHRPIHLHRRNGWFYHHFNRLRRERSHRRCEFG